MQTSATNAVSLDRVADRARGLIDGSGKGGGGGEEDARSDFRFTAHWEPALRTDAAGNATLTVRLPDTLTTWRLTARGITRASQAGMAETKVQSSRPLIVRPVTPRFFTAGDRPELGAIVNNLTDAPQDVRLSLTAEGLTLEGDTARTVRVEPGKQGLVSWRAAVPAEGTARLRWSAAAGGGLSDAVELTRPVHALATPEVAVSAGAVSDRAVEVVRAPAAGASGDVTLELWPSLTATLPQTVRYLREFPYECVEQTSSRMLSALGLAAARGTPADASDITRWVQRLYSQQHPDGGWGWWAADPSDPQMSAYAVTALVAARTAGHSVDANVLERAGAYLRGELERPRDAAAPMNPNLRAFLIYALTGLNGDGISRAVALAERRATLGPEGKALVALALQRGQQDRSDPRLRALLTDLRSSAMLSAGSARWDDPVSAPGRLTTATRTTAFALWALAQADPRDPLVDGAVRWLMNERREGRWSSTQDSALVVLALGAVAQAREEGAAYSYRVTLNDRALREERVERPAVADPTTLAIRGELVGGDNRLVLTRDPGDAPGRLYYQVAYRVFAPAQGIGAQDRGIAVAREFLSPDDDRSLTRVRAGDLVKVRVTVLASGTLNYVAVEDFLPAGLEAVDASLRTTTREIAQRQRAEAERQAKLRGAACRIAFRSCYSPFTHADIRDDRVALFAQSMPKGAHEYVYFARATAAGTYLVRPSVVSELYFPDVRGRSDSGTFVVEP
ncbi:MAG: alpha-2-macroglobulin family protein [Dehalococcoidia bacterium]